MIQKLKNAPLKFKLIIAFCLIIIFNATSGLINLNVIKDLGNLVTMTYDKALMTGNFSQASKFDFAQIDLQMHAVILAKNNNELEKHLARLKKSEEILLEDLDVVVERTLSPRSADLVAEIKERLKAIESLKLQVIDQKKVMLDKNKGNKELVELLRTWEMNSDKKTLIRKLTAINDDAAVVGYQFRLDSEAKNKKNLQYTFLILTLCIIVSLILSFTVSYLIIKPLLSLQNICKTVSEGDLTIRSDDVSTDEFGTLSKSFNFMLNTIHEKSENISTLLASLPFALFYFDKDGNISKERSQATDKIFKSFSSYSTLSDFFVQNNVSVNKLEVILSAIFQNLIPFNSAAQLLPQRLEIAQTEGSRIIQLSYRPKFEKKNKVERVIVIAEDVTEKTLAMKKSTELAERVERVSKISADVSGFKEFLPAVSALYDSIDEKLTNFNASKMTDIKRELHSLKGLLGIFSFSHCASTIHEIETYIEVDFENKIRETLEKTRSSRALYLEHANDMTDLLKLNVDSSLKFYNEAKINTLSRLLDANKLHELKDAISSLDKFPIEKVFSKYVAHVETTAKKLGNKKVQVQFSSSSDLSYEEISKLDAIFIHLLNNSIDHGIESTDDRLSENKPELGIIKIDFKRSLDNSLVFQISDDGKGIDGNSLLEKAVQKELIAETEAKSFSELEKINLIFLSGLSSKDSTSEISGRGVGMDAVKAMIESLGGEIHLETKLKTGTSFTIKIGKPT